LKELEQKLDLKFQWTLNEQPQYLQEAQRVTQMLWKDLKFYTMRLRSSVEGMEVSEYFRDNISTAAIAKDYPVDLD
jgi:hypothetical protein